MPYADNGMQDSDGKADVNDVHPEIQYQYNRIKSYAELDNNGLLFI